MDIPEMCRLPTNTPQYMTDPGFELYTGSNMDGSFLLWPGEHNVHYFYKEYESLTHQTAIHVSTVHQSISDELWALLTFEFCCAQCSLNLLRKTVFIDNGLSKYSQAHVEMFNTEACQFLMQCCLRD